MKVHEKYKTFDVEWIANPRIDWETKRLKYFIQRVTGGGTPSTGDAEYWRGDIPWVSSKDMKTSIIRDTEEHISERAVEESSTSRIDPGTVLMVARSGILKHTLPVAITDVPLTINQDIKAFTVDETLLPRFLFWRLKGTESDILDICGKVGATVESIDVEALLSLPVSIPGLEEQTAIADYLDNETARIDEVVGKKKWLIELLKEERLAIINHAVTRGLDPNAKLKPSNIEWLGDIPEHWEVVAVGYRFQVRLGKMLDEKRITGKFLAPYLRNIDVQWGKINTDDLPLMDFSDEDREKYSLRKGDLLICEGGEVGRSAIWNAEIPECYYQKALHRVRPHDPAQNDLEYMLNAMLIASERGLFAETGNSSTIEHLPAEKLRKHRLPIPPIDEQKDIVRFIKAKVEKIDATITKVEKEIGLLNEYRTALISEVVTGKIRVS